MLKSLPASTFREAVNGLIATPEEKAALLRRIPADKTAVAATLAEEERPLLQELLKLRLAKPTRTRITQYLHQAKVPARTGAAARRVATALAEKPGDFDTCLNAVLGLQGQPFEIKVMDRWYLFRLPRLEMAKCQKRIVGFVIAVKFQMVRTVYRVTKVVYRENFKDAHGDKTLAEILGDLGIRAYAPQADPEQDHGRLVSLSVGLAEGPPNGGASGRPSWKRLGCKRRRRFWTGWPS